MMVKRMCPHCRAGNEMARTICTNCGRSLESKPIIVSGERSLSIRGVELPAEQLKQLGQAVAVGLLTLAAEAGMAWLRRRAERIGGDPVTLIRPAASPAPARQSTEIVPLNRQEGRTVTVWSQRVVEVWQWGRLASRVTERSVWRSEE